MTERSRDRATSLRDHGNVPHYIRDRYRDARDDQRGDHAEPADPPDPAGTEGRRLHLALLPARAFLGITFLYAGLDKFLSPAFLHDSGPGSIGQQLGDFVRVSPIAPLIQLLAQPFPVLVGLLIAVAEIAIGIAILTGVIYRPAAIAGTALSALFFFTASWSTQPYYSGPDLPYALGWLSLAIAGHGGLFALDARLDARFGSWVPVDRFGLETTEARAVGWEIDPERRAILRAAFVGGTAVVLAGISGLLGASRSSVSARAAVAGGPGVARGSGAGSGAPSPGMPSPGAAAGATDSPLLTIGAGGSPTAQPHATARPHPTAIARTTPAPTADPGSVLANLSQIKPRQALPITVPTNGDPGILVRLGDGSVVGFDAVCTHQGCTVEYDRGSGLLRCPCHGALFDPTNRAHPVGGPARTPLPIIALRVDKASGEILFNG